MKHKHNELIKAWADGAKIQLVRNGIWSDEWFDVETPDWSEHEEYRIKPKNKHKAHKHKELIDAHKAGARIEFKNSAGVWRYIEVPLWKENVVYRIKNKHQDLIDAYNDVAEIQVLWDDVWSDTSCPLWIEDYEYRIKPTKKD
jgi:hypothetical protein